MTKHPEDEYDPATGTKVRKDMGGDVLRSRRKLTRNDTDSGSSSASESIQTDGTSSASVSQVPLGCSFLKFPAVAVQ